MFYIALIKSQFNGNSILFKEKVVKFYIYDSIVLGIVMIYQTDSYFLMVLLAVEVVWFHVQVFDLQLTNLILDGIMGGFQIVTRKENSYIDSSNWNDFLTILDTVSLTLYYYEGFKLAMQKNRKLGVFDWHL